MKKKIFLSILFIFLVGFVFVNVHASGFIDKIITQGNSFANSGTSTSLGTKISAFIKGDIMKTILAIGNLVFAAITVILGAKYIWSSADGKAQVLESLPAFVVAIVFFYLGETLVTSWINPAASEIAGSSSWSTIAGKILGTINLVVRYAAFGGIIVLGVRYMFASAEGKSNLKTSAGALCLGIAFVFCASKVVDFIIDIVEGAI